MRLMPLILVAGGLAGVAKTAPGVTDRVLTTFRSVAVRHEIGTIARLLENGLTLGTSVPRPGDPQGFATFIRENMSARGGRDPSLDLWETPYRLEGTAKNLVVVSCGANTTRETCPESFAPAEPGSEPSGPDDLCEPVSPPN